MIGAERFLTVILVSDLLSVMIVASGSRQTCPTAVIIDLTIETRDYTGSVNKSGEVYPPEAIWTENGRRFGCPCNIKTCIQLCCSMGNGIGEEDCFKENSTLLESFRKNYITGDIHVFVNEPCRMNDSVMIKRYKMFLEGRFNNSENVPPNDDFANYCQEWGEHSIANLVGVCVAEESYSLLPWFLSCINISTIFTLATFVVYTVIPELKNLQGSIFRCYLASYISGMLLFTIFLLRPGYVTSNIADAIIGIGFMYFGVACILWLNVMTFDIWKTFRKFRPVIDNSNSNKRQRKKFKYYSIYAWGCSGVFVLSLYIFITLRSYFSVDGFIKCLPFLPIAGIAVCNTCLFISTALSIKKQKKETAYLVDGMNKHHQENEQWFNLYLKLFVIMGGPLIIWVVAIGLSSTIFWRIVYVIEALQGTSVFLVFVWKDDVKQLLRKGFNGLMITLGSYCKGDTTPDSKH